MQKNLFIAGMLLLSSMQVQAQKFTAYNKSVFSHLPPVHNYDKQTALVSKVKSFFPDWNVGIDLRSGTFKDIFGKAMPISGSTIQGKLNTCFEQKLAPLGINSANWKQTRLKNTSKFTIADYTEVLNGHSVVFSRLSFWFTTSGDLLRIQMKNYGTPTVTTPELSATQAATAAVKDLGNIKITATDIAKDWSWFPVPVKETYELHPAWHFNIKGTVNKAKVQLSGYIDGINGNVLYRTNDLHDVFDLKVNGKVYVTDPTDPATLQPLRHLQVYPTASALLTDTTGYCTDPGIDSLEFTTIPLQGSYANVVDLNIGMAPTENDNVLSRGSVFTFPTTTTYPSATGTDRDVNAYYHTTLVHDYMKTVMPTLTDLDMPITVNVDDASGTCNAFFNPSDFSLNFFVAGGGCNAFSEIGTVVYHEYGHAITQDFYGIATGMGMNSSALNEGNSDVWAMCVAHTPIIGKRSSSTNYYIRRYDEAPMIYPVDLGGEGHQDGQIIAGAWWDVAQNFGNVDSMATLFTDVYNDVPDGADGTEGEIYHSVLVSALMYDDNDGDINNGTRNFAKIAGAFARHGIYLTGNLSIEHTELNQQKASVAVATSALVNAEYPDYLRGVKCYYRNRDSATWRNPATLKIGSTYSTVIPPQPAGSIIDYYFAVRDTLSFVDAYAPFFYNPNATAINTSIPYQYGVGLITKDSTTFETTAIKWHIGSQPGDNATSGIWVQDNPEASFLFPMNSALQCQTGQDHTTGFGQCLITGNTSPTAPAGTADVDDGTTTVLTPVFDVSRFIQPVVSYYRWYSNHVGSNPGTDTWSVQMRDTSVGGWVNVDVTHQSDESWRRRIFAVKEFITNGKYIQLKFVASDPTNTSKLEDDQSIVEAGIDDFFIYDKKPVGVPTVENDLQAHIYPNPANDIVQVELPAANNSGSIQLYNLTGQIVATLPLQENMTKYSVSTKSLAPGQYIMVIQSDNFIQSQKLIIKH